MPIKLPSNFPASEKLVAEGIESLSFERANSQDIRPLKVILFNLMPTKIATETQILRLLSRSSIQIEPVFLRTASYQPKHFEDHLDRFYATFDDVKNERFDAIIISGAPVEQLDFEDVEYWNEFTQIVSWANSNVFAKLYICWGAQAGLYVDFGVKKLALEEKLCGVYRHAVPPIMKNNRLMRGFDDEFFIPQSRWTKLDENDLQKVIEKGMLIPLAVGKETGINILTTPHMHKTYLVGHLEYDRETLQDEFLRDSATNPKTPPPLNYFADEQNNKDPQMQWISAANLFFINWINYVYQETPYDLSKLQPCKF